MVNFPFVKVLRIKYNIYKLLWVGSPFQDEYEFEVRDRGPNPESDHFISLFLCFFALITDKFEAEGCRTLIRKDGQTLGSWGHLSAFVRLPDANCETNQNGQKRNNTLINLWTRVLTEWYFFSSFCVLLINSVFAPQMLILFVSDLKFLFVKGWRLQQPYTTAAHNKRKWVTVIFGLSQTPSCFQIRRTEITENLTSSIKSNVLTNSVFIILLYHILMQYF